MFPLHSIHQHTKETSSMSCQSQQIPYRYFNCTSLAEYLRKAINFLRKLVPNSELLKDEEAPAEILGELFNMGCCKRQQVKDNIFGQETKIGLYRTARHSD